MATCYLNRQLLATDPILFKNQPNARDTYEVADKVECFFHLWNLFATAPVESATFFCGSEQVEKANLYEMVASHRLLEAFFMNDVLAHLSPNDMPLLALFLQQILWHLLDHGRVLTDADAMCVAHMIVLCWWSGAFLTPSHYALLSSQLHRLFVQSLDRISFTFLTQLSRFPESANLFVVQVLRLYTEATRNVERERLEHSRKPNSEEDAASRLLGVHASHMFQQLGHIYRKSRLALEPIEDELGCSVGDSQTMVVVRLLELLVTSGLVDSLRQRPDLSLTLGAKQLLVDRFALLRDYFTTQACRSLARDLSDPLLSRSASKLSCLIYAGAPKHLTATLLSSDPSDSSSTASDESRGSFTAHADVICWALDHELCIKDYANWFVSLSEVKDVSLANGVLARLTKHSNLFAKDHVFCQALIHRMDRVRKAALPEHEYLKLLRQLLSRLSGASKARLLEELHSPISASVPTPLPTSGTHLEARTRQLFNRLTVTDSTTQPPGEEGYVPSRIDISSNKEMPLY